MTEKNEREPYIQQMICDNQVVNILTWRSVGSIEGDCLVWRFVTTEGQIVTVRPIQIPSNTRPISVPRAINSAMTEISCLLMQAHGQMFANVGSPGAPDQARRIMTLCLINEVIWCVTDKRPVPGPKMRPVDSYTVKEWAAISKRLTDPKNPGAAKLEAIRAFILKSCDPKVNKITDRTLRGLVRFIGEQIGQDIALPVMKSYVETAHLNRGFTIAEVEEMRRNPSKNYPRPLDRWVRETAKTRGITLKEATRFLAEHVTFIAECEGKRFMHLYPIEDITIETDTMDGEDLGNFRRAGGKLNRIITPQVELNTLQKPAEHKTLLTSEIFPDLMTRDQACHFLKISQATLTIWIKRGWIKKRGRGHIVRFRKTELIEAFQVYGKK